MVLVGIGEEFAPELPEYAGQAELAPFSKSKFYREIPDSHEIIQAYNNLRELIGHRPYFVVTLNTDDLIYRSNFEQDLIVAPCGSMGKMQCDEHIVDAEPVCDTRKFVFTPPGYTLQTPILSALTSLVRILLIPSMASLVAL